MRALVGVYYAPVRITGREKLPPGPVLFVANHSDSLPDPVLLGSAAKRKVRFLAPAARAAAATQGDGDAGCACFVEEAGFLLTLGMPGSDLPMK